MFLGIGYALSQSLAAALPLALVLYLLFYLSMVVHETGHYLMAKALGLAVPVLSIGGSRRHVSVRWRETTVLIGPSPTDGLVTLSGMHADLYRIQSALVVASGPGINLLVAVLVFIALRHGLVSPSLHDALVMLMIVNAFVGISNLLPLTMKGPYGPLGSDGLQLLQLSRMSPAEAARRVTGARLDHAFAELRVGHAERALALVEPLLEEEEFGVIARRLRVAGLAGAGRTEDAAQEAARLLASADMQVHERAIAENDLAYTLLLTGDSSRLEEAEVLARSAYRVLPMQLSVISTLGSVLVAREKFEEGLALLSDRRFRIESASNRASVLAARAMAERGLGFGDRAERSLARAARLDAGHPLVTRGAAA